MLIRGESSFFIIFPHPQVSFWEIPMASMAEERPESSNLTAHRGSIRIDHLVGSCRVSEQRSRQVISPWSVSISCDGWRVLNLHQGNLILHQEVLDGLNMAKWATVLSDTFCHCQVAVHFFCSSATQLMQ